MEEKKLRKISDEELKEILKKHALWLETEKSEGECADLRRTDLSGKIIKGAILNFAHLEGADLRNAHIEGIRPWQPHSEGRRPWRPHQEGPVLLEAHLEGADLRGAHMRGAKLLGAHLEEALLNNAHLEGADIRGAHMQGCNLREAHLEGANLSGAHLEKAHLTLAHLEEALLYGAHLEGANLAGAHLEEAILKDAHLEGASLWKTHLEGADLCKAHLEGANVLHTHLEGADLSEADLRDANVSGVIWDRNMKCRSANVETCYGSQRFKREVQDMDFLNEFQERNPKTYWIWLLFADCGRSLSRWGLWCLFLSLAFARLIFHMGTDHFDASPIDFTGFSSIYYSVVTFTSFGFGDITPRTDEGALVLMVEAILGYIMLGGLIAIFANKLARRS